MNPQNLPGTFSAMSSPLEDRIGHMLSGVSAKIAIKVKGDDLAELQRIGTEIQTIAPDRYNVVAVVPGANPGKSLLLNVLVQN